MSVEVFPECPCFIMVMRSACTGDADVGGNNEHLGASAMETHGNFCGSSTGTATTVPLDSPDDSREARAMLSMSTSFFNGHSARRPLLWFGDALIVSRLATKRNGLSASLSSCVGWAKSLGQTRSELKAKRVPEINT
jgi:hypothetical protein